MKLLGLQVHEEAVLHSMVKNVGVIKHIHETEGFRLQYCSFLDLVKDHTPSLATISSEREIRTYLNALLENNPSICDADDYYLIISKYIDSFFVYNKTIGSILADDNPLEITIVGDTANYRCYTGERKTTRLHSEEIDDLELRYYSCYLGYDQTAILPDGNLLYKGNGAKFFSRHGMSEKYFILYNRKSLIIQEDNLFNKYINLLKNRNSVLVCGEKSILNQMFVSASVRYTTWIGESFLAEKYPSVVPNRVNMRSAFIDEQGDYGALMGILAKGGYNNIIFDEIFIDNVQTYCYISKYSNITSLTSYKTYSLHEALDAMGSILDYNYKKMKIDYMIYLEYKEGKLSISEISKVVVDEKDHSQASLCPLQ